MVKEKVGLGINAASHRAFIDFMTDYTAFLEQMCLDEKEKLSALSSRELRKIEHSIAVSQANAKQLENFEKKRAELQKAAGYEDMTFRQLIMETPDGGQEHLWQLFTRFEGAVAKIRFFNDKSMAVARDNMVGIDPEMVLAGTRGGGKENPYSRLRDEQNENTKILETKV